MADGAVQKIKDRLNVVEVLGSYITLEKSGANFKARCPFHNEKTPSFFVSPDRGNYYCFGCGAKGDIFTFVQEFESIDFPGALTMLADRAGVVLEKFQGEKNSTTRLFELLEDASLFWRSILKEKEEALLYLKKRGLQIELVRDWKIGFAPDAWRDTKEYLSKKGYSEKELLEAGIVKHGEGGTTYDRFRNRVMFPIFDSSGRIVGFSGRILHDTPHEPKYLNSPETPLFEKSKILYGMHKAKVAIREKGYAVLVEGQMDLLLCHQIGFTNTVASSGTAFTAEQAGLLKRLTDTLVILYDADKAGQAASLRANTLALRAGLVVKIGSLAQGLDPALAALQNPALINDAIGGAMNVVDYFLNISKQKKSAGDNEGSDLILKSILIPLMSSVENSIEKSRYVQKVSLETGVPEQALWEEISKVPAEEVLTSESKAQTLVSKEANTSTTSKRIMMLFLLAKEQQSKSLEFLIDSLKQIDDQYELLLKGAEREADSLIFEAHMHYGNSPNLEDPMKEALLYFEEESIKRKFSKSMENLKRAETTRDLATIEKLLGECQNYSKQLSELQKKYLMVNK